MVLLLAGIVVITATAQGVIVIGKKQIYRRPRPLDEGKRTFSIRRPIAKTANASLSRKITKALKPESVLGIRVNDEMRDYQWLYEADFRVQYNGNGVLTVEEWMEGSGAYPSSVAKHVVVNTVTGNRVRPVDIFNNLSSLARMVKRRQSEEVRAAIVKSEDSAPLFAETNFTVKDLFDFSVGTTGVTFHYNYGFPHAILAEQPDGEFAFSWKEISPFIRRDGLLARFIR